MDYDCQNFFLCVLPLALWCEWTTPAQPLSSTQHQVPVHPFITPLWSSYDRSLEHISRALRIDANPHVVSSDTQFPLQRSIQPHTVARRIRERDGVTILDAAVDDAVIGVGNASCW